MVKDLRESACLPRTPDPSIQLTPRGRLRLVRGDSAASGHGRFEGEAKALSRIEQAFQRGDGHGVFHLGAVEVGTTLPPTLSFWRELGKLFVTKLRGLHDIEEQRERFNLSLSGAELATFVLAPPPMIGGEYLTPECLDALWTAVCDACREEISESGVSVAEFLKSKNSVWNVVGRVHFHLAEQKGNTTTPFAFLATYTSGLGAGKKVKHLPLARALEEYSADRSRLLSLLAPVRAAAERSEFLRRLVDAKAIYHPLSWTAAEARAFLVEIPACEESGIVVKVPDWWKDRRARRPVVSVTVGSNGPTRVGLEALLSFSVELSLDGTAMNKTEIRELLEANEGLAFIRGRWTEVDAEKLRAVLSYWEHAEKAARGGISFAESLRMLAGADIAAGDAEIEGDVKKWSVRVAGPWLREALERLRCPGECKAAARSKVMKVLRPYQRVGVEWLRTLRTLGLGGCLADDMGLGKTAQVLALLETTRRENADVSNKSNKTGTAHAQAPSLLVAPTSLISNWLAEVEKFTPGLRVFVAHSSARPVKELQAMGPEDIVDHDLVVTTYGTVSRLSWLQEVEWDTVVLDEAQAIKNASAKQTRVVKKLPGHFRVALTGTPVENRLTDLWSIFDFVNSGLLGSAKAFGEFTKRLAARSEGRYAPLRELVAPYILRRLKTDRSIIDDLPDKTEVIAYCSLTKLQAALYEEGVAELRRRLTELDGIQRRGVVLSFLNRFKQVCNHPAQWFSDGDWDEEKSGKLGRLRELCETFAERQEKVLVFTQYREAIDPLDAFLAEVFGRPGLVLHGGTTVAKRRRAVERFQEDETVPFFVISLRAGGTGLNLTAASHVVHFDRWWNPAVEDQATDRAYRIGQRRNVLVHKFVCRGTVEEKVDEIIREKRAVSEEILEGGSEKLITEMDDDALLELVSLDMRRAIGEGSR